MLAGFHCAKRVEWRARARLLHEDAGLRARMSAEAGEWARGELCDAARHRAVWRRVLDPV